MQQNSFCLWHGDRDATINHIINWCGLKVGTQKENMEHGLEVRKIYLQKLQRIVSNIGSRTSCTTATTTPGVTILLPY